MNAKVSEISPLRAAEGVPKPPHLLMAPLVQTERLTLRHHKIEDFDPMVALFGSDRAQYMGGPISAKDAWRWIGSEVGMWSLLGFGAWAIERREDKAFMGQVGLMKPAHFPEIELGWTLLEDFEGKGYAAEAAMAARKFAFVRLDLDSVVSYIAPGNARSIALAQRLGARHDTNASLPDGETAKDTLVYRHLRSEVA